MKRTLNAHWFWFFLIFLGAFAYDFIAHIHMEASVCQRHPIQWLWYSSSVAALFCLTLYFGAHALRRLRIPGVMPDLLAFALAVFLHEAFFGPRMNALLWPFEELTFDPSYQTVGTFLLGYIVFRIVFLMVHSLVNKGR